MTLEGKDIVVTGGAGFIGSWIARRLSTENRVKVLDNLSSGKRENLSGTRNVAVVKGDVRDKNAVSGALKGADVVFHEAANVQIQASIKDPAMDAEINIGGTLNVLESCRKHDVGRMVFASSSAIYGNPKKLPVEEGHPSRPLSPYALSKFSGETYARLYGELYGVESVFLRYFNVYGPGQNADSPYSGVISIFMKNIADGRTLKVYGDGGQTRDFVNVSDVVSANILAASSKDAPGKAFNIGTGKAVSLNDLIATIKSITGREAEVLYESQRKGDVKHSCADITLARRVLGYSPTVTLDDGLRGMTGMRGSHPGARHGT